MLPAVELVLRGGEIGNGRSVGEEELHMARHARGDHDEDVDDQNRSAPDFEEGSQSHQDHQDDNFVDVRVGHHAPPQPHHPQDGRAR